eukprot:13351095-Alexandrium_andersonii.AAC.1
MTRLVAAAFASLTRVRWAGPSPASRPVNIDCRSCRAATYRATSARYAAVPRPCSSALACGAR